MREINNHNVFMRIKGISSYFSQFRKILWSKITVYILLKWNIYVSKLLQYFQTNEISILQIDHSFNVKIQVSKFS